MTNKRLTAIDLFSGCGGLTEGLRSAGFKVVAAIEIDGKATETYALNHPDVRLYQSDIRKLTASQLLLDAKLRTKELDLLAGCPPCQGFSRLRTQNRLVASPDPRNDLIFEFLRFVRVMRPRTIMFENVPALRHDERFVKFCRELVRLRYNIVVEVLDAADFSVAQRRKRLILLGSRVHVPVMATKSVKRLTVRDVIFDLAPPKKSDDPLHALSEQRSGAVREIIKRIPKDGGSQSQLPSEYQLSCHKKSRGFYDVYGRMAWDDVAPTITSGCANPSKGRFLHPQQNRAITLREASILQGFPLNYRFHVRHGKEAISLMIGNALPPPFIFAHANTLRREIVKVGRLSDSTKERHERTE